MVELNLNLETRYVGGITIDDMVKKFGKRIRKAVVYENEKPHGLSSVEIVKLMRWWKFWNKDIREAYNKYTGLLYVPWTIEYGKPELYYNEDIDWNKLNEEILNKYINKPVDPKFYSQLKIVKDEKMDT